MSTWNVVAKEPEIAFYRNPTLSEPVLELSLPSSKESDRIRCNIFDLLPKDRELPDELLDLCLLATVVYSADIKIPRNVASDRWTRKIRVHMPVKNVERWQSVAIDLANTLGFLSGDHWEFEFRQGKASYTQVGRLVEKCDAVSLLSGGLDSLVGAIDLLDKSKRVAFVGHHGAGITNTIQQNVLAHLQSHYGELVEPFSFYVQAPKIVGSTNEQTMRARSFLFICLGLAVTGSIGGKELTVAENGFISLNVPLTSSRIGSLSTRTTHPFFISSLEKVLRQLGISTRISLPYQFKTKGEMIGDAVNKKILWQVIPKTMSCTHPESGRFASKSPTNHCGYCVPCIIRRASLSASGKDRTNYNVSIKRKKPDSSTAKGRDLRAFLMAVERYRTRKAHQILFDVISSGPLDPISIADFTDVYRRGMQEVIAII